MMSLKTAFTIIILCCAVIIGAIYYWVGFARPAQGNSMDYPTDSQQVTITPIVQGLEHPWSVEFLPDGDFLITERGGKLIYGDQDGNTSQVTGVPAVYNDGQGGLLDIVRAPDYAQSHMVYFSYAAADDKRHSNTEVARAVFNVDQKKLENVEVIFTTLPKVSGSNHYGSRLQFDREGHLYISLGERYSHRDEAQNTKNHLGTMVRIHADGSIPSDNPFINDDASRPEIYSYGHRNIQGMAMHPETGDIWIHEHGPRGGDEINIIEKGANYGWPIVSYGVNYSGIPVSSSPTADGVTEPVLYWTPSIAPSGMVFYNGDDFPEWRGDILVGALAERHLRRVIMNGEHIKSQSILLQDFENRIRDVAVSDQGKLYVLTDEYEGGLYRITPAQ